MTIFELLSTTSHFLIGFYFVFFGFWNIYHWGPTLIVMGEKKIPLAQILLPLAIVWEIVAGCMIIFDIYTKFAALSLIPFTLIAISLFHPFWKFQGQLWVLNFTIFMANITVTVAALLLLII